MEDTINQSKDARSYRLTNIDMMRGLVIIIMALDHVRDYIMIGGVQNPMEQPDIGIGLYLTRWITHFCAPVFIFLAGTSIGLMSGRKSRNDIASFVFKRGLWLIIVEIVIVSTGWTFTPFGEEAIGGYTITMLQVIWALGICMIILSVAQYMGQHVCLMLGALILIGQHLLEPIWPTGTIFSEDDPIWIFLFSQGSVHFGPFLFNVLYPLIPCIGLMLLGFGSTSIFLKNAVAQKKILVKIGLIFISSFVVIRLTGMYGDPNPWAVNQSGAIATIFDFLNVTKYPASLLFLLATLGPMAILCAYTDSWTGKLKEILIMFGRVPFAFYIAHVYLIHALSILLGVLQGYDASQFTRFFIFYPGEFGVGLIGVYLCWLAVIIILFPLCKWVSLVKQRRKDWWLSYL